MSKHASKRNVSSCRHASHNDYYFAFSSCIFFPIENRNTTILLPIHMNDENDPTCGAESIGIFFHSLTFSHRFCNDKQHERQLDLNLQSEGRVTITEGIKAECTLIN